MSGRVSNRRDRIHKSDRAGQTARTDCGRCKGGTSLRRRHGHGRGSRTPASRDMTQRQLGGLRAGEVCMPAAGDARDVLVRAMLCGSLSVSALLGRIDRLLRYVRQSTEAKRLSPALERRLRSDLLHLRQGLAASRCVSSASNRGTYACSCGKNITGGAADATTEGCDLNQETEMQ